MRHSTIGRKKKARTEEPIIYGLCAPCSPCTLAPLGVSRIEELKNRRTQEPKTHKAKNTRVEDLWALRSMHPSPVGRLKNRQTQKSKNARTEERKNRWALDFARMRPMHTSTIGLSRIDKLRNFRTQEPKNARIQEWKNTRMEECMNWRSMGTAPHAYQFVDHLCKCLPTYLLKSFLSMKTDKIYEILADAPEVEHSMTMGATSDKCT